MDIESTPAQSDGGGRRGRRSPHLMPGQPPWNRGGIDLGEKARRETPGDGDQRGARRPSPAVPVFPRTGCPPHLGAFLKGGYGATGLCPTLPRAVSATLNHRMLVTVAQSEGGSMTVTGYEPLTSGSLSVVIGPSAMLRMSESEGLEAGTTGMPATPLLARSAKLPRPVPILVSRRTCLRAVYPDRISRRYVVRSGVYRWSRPSTLFRDTDIHYRPAARTGRKLAVSSCGRSLPSRRPTMPKPRPLPLVGNPAGSAAGTSCATPRACSGPPLWAGPRPSSWCSRERRLPSRHPSSPPPLPGQRVPGPACQGRAMAPGFITGGRTARRARGTRGAAPE